MFNSITNRFELTYKAKNPNIRLLTSKSVPRKKIVTQTADRKMVFQDQKELGIENQITCLGVTTNPDSDWFH